MRTFSKHSRRNSLTEINREIFNLASAQAAKTIKLKVILGRKNYQISWLKLRINSAWKGVGEGFLKSSE